MKKMIVMFSLIVGTIFLGVSMFAQDIPVPDDVLDIITQLNLYMGSMAGVAAVTAFLAALLNGLLKVEKKFVKQLVAWIVAILILVITDLFNFGFAAEFSILKAVIYGVGTGFVANGIFDIPVIKSILDKVEGWFKPAA